MDNAFISKFLFYYEKILKEIDYSFVDIKVVKLGYHCLLVFQIFFIGVNQAISFVYYTSNIIKNLAVHVFLKSC